MTFEEARALFPALERVAYLNAGSMGPLAIPMFETMQRELRRQLEDGRGGLPFFERMVELRAGVREQLAGLLGVAQENLALTTSTTEACNIVLSGLDLGPQTRSSQARPSTSGCWARCKSPAPRSAWRPTTGSSKPSPTAPG